GASQEGYARKLRALHQHRVVDGLYEEERDGCVEDAGGDQRELPFAMQIGRLCRLGAKRLDSRDQVVAVCREMPLGRLAETVAKRAVRDGQIRIVRLEFARRHPGQRPYRTAGSEGGFETGRHGLDAEDDGRLRLGLQLAEADLRV